ncbi:MAG: hypothetical protein ISS31_01120 [Kiritimatiellae bacterium]|nr:hypothetical protein [Kiritimatiellia bacterium]
MRTQVRSFRDLRRRHPRLWKYGRVVIHATLFATVMYYVLVVLAGRLAGLSLADLRVDMGVAAISVALLVMSRVVTVLTYRQTVSMFMSPPAWREFVVIAFVPSLAKYVPGKVTGFLGALWFFDRAGVRVPIASATLLIMRVLILAVAFMVSLPALIVTVGFGRIGTMWAWGLLLAIVVAAAMHPRVFKPVANRVLTRLGARELERTPRPGEFLAPATTVFVQWLCTGASLWFMARALSPLSIDTLPLCISATALANVLGYIAFFAPAGLGVREGVLLFAMGSIMADDQLAITVIMLRVVEMAVEVALAGIGIAVQHLPRQHTG